MRNPTRNARTPKAIAAFSLALLLLTACGGNRVILNLDMDSFMPLEERLFEYPLIDPGGSFTHDSSIEPVVTPEGMKDIITLEEMQLDLQVVLDNTDVVGIMSMAVIVDVHLAASSQPAQFWQPANRIARLQGVLTGGEISTLEDVFDAADYLDLFQENDTLYLGLSFHLEHVDGLGMVQGEAEVTRLHLHVEAKENMM